MARGKTAVWRVCLVTGIAVILYIITMPSQFITGDSAVEMALAQSKSTAVRPSHLLITPTFSLVARLGDLLNPGLKPFWLLQIADILCGIACAIFLYLILRLLSIDAVFSIYLLILFFLANSIWIHAGTVETGIQSLLLWIISIYYFLRYTEGGSSINFLIITLTTACLAVLFALNLVVLIAVLLFAIGIDWYRRRHIALFRLASITVLTIGLIGVAPFLILAYSKGIRDISGFIIWLTEHPEKIRLVGLLEFSPEILFRTIAGAIKMLFRLDDGLVAIKMVVRGEAAQGIKLWSYIQSFLSITTILALGLLIYYGIRTKFMISLKLLIILSLVVVFLFNLKWLGSDPQFWLPTLPLVLIILGVVMQRFASKMKSNILFPIAGAMIVVLFLIINIPREIPSILFPHGGRDVRKALDFGGRVQAGDIILTPGAGWVHYLKHFQSDVILINLVYNEQIGIGNEFIDNIDRIITKALEEDRLVYVDGITGQVFADQYGPWQMFGSYRRLSREDFARHLESRFLLEPVYGLSDGRMSVIRFRADDNL